MKKKKAVKKGVKKAKKKIAAKKKAVKRPKKTAGAGKKKAASKAKAVKKKSSLPEGASLEEAGIITHYFPKVDAAVVKLTKAGLSVGDRIFIKGHTSDFVETVESIQLDHIVIQNSEVGQEIGLKVKSKVREHDVVYRIIS